MRILTLILLLVATPMVSADDATGTLKITFRLKGDVPAAKPLNPQGCGNVKLVDESLVVNKENKGVANIFVYIFTGRGGMRLPPVPPKNAKHELANKDCRFEPHALVLQAGDTLKITNPDPIGHNAKLDFFNNKSENFLIPPGNFAEVVLPLAEPAPTKVVCNIHPWMQSQVLVLNHPFADVSDENGVVTIEGLPTGKVKFRAGHEKENFKDQIFINGKKDKWKSNNFEVKIKKGMNDMGVVELPW